MPDNIYFYAFLLVLGSVTASIVGLLVTRKVLTHETLRKSHEVGGYFLAVVGTLYAVLLGLVVVDAMQRYQQAQNISEQEAASLVDVFVLSAQLPKEMRTQVQYMCNEYAAQVIRTETGAMKNGTYCPLAREKAIDLMRDLMDFEPQSENEKALYPQMVQEASAFWQNRQRRITMAGAGLPVMEWIVLIAGAFFTIFFTYFFVLEDVRLQMVMTGIVAVLISLNLSLIFVFEHPFAGDENLSAHSFEAVRGVFAHLNKHEAM
jgi:Protein of unknown function (DUF4239)